MANVSEQFLLKKIREKDIEKKEAEAALYSLEIGDPRYGEWKDKFENIRQEIDKLYVELRKLQ